MAQPWMGERGMVRGPGSSRLWFLQKPLNDACVFCGVMCVRGTPCLADLELLKGPAQRLSSLRGLLGQS